MQNLDVNHKVVLITGAGSGIGQETAIKFAQQGAHVIIADISQEGLDKTEHLVVQAGGRCEKHVVDVTSKQQMKALALKVEEAHGALTVLINNAGVLVIGPLLATSESSWNKLIDVNIRGVINGSEAFIPAMIRAGKPAAVVNLASTASFFSPRDMAAYSMTKFAVLGYSEGLRAELHDYNISVTAICPGIIKTPLIQSTTMEGDLADTDAKDRIDKMYIKRNYGPDRVARAIYNATIKRKKVVPVSIEAWLAYYAKRFVPSIMARIGRVRAVK